MRKIERVTRWQTRDGKLHSREEQAQRWAQRLDDVDAANEMLKQGATVADALRRAGRHVDDGSVLEQITAKTPLVVGHYQCRDEPGYKACRIENDLQVFVFGDAGSWSGSYGHAEPVSSVERYAEHTLKRHPELAGATDGLC